MIQNNSFIGYELLLYVITIGNYSFGIYILFLLLSLNLCVTAQDCL